MPCLCTYVALCKHVCQLRYPAKLSNLRATVRHNTCLLNCQGIQYYVTSALNRKSRPIRSHKSIGTRCSTPRLIASVIWTINQYMYMGWNPHFSDTRPKKWKKTQKKRISQKRCIVQKKMFSTSFLCSSSRGIQRSLFQVATTNRILCCGRKCRFRPKMTKYKNTKSQISRKLCIGRQIFEHQFCAARWEESNGSCFRSLRPTVFELWSKM